ncbi:MAG: phospholipase [Acidobacteriota bacterium]|nr:phospholipase [Acidobacteriota bacterium]
MTADPHGGAPAEHWLPATTHGRYLLEVPEGPGPFPLLMGFHGYGEAAEDLLAELRRIPGAEGWALCVVEALHRFYNRRQQTVVASWMTRRGRDQGIRDNIAYVGAVAARVREAVPVTGATVFAGFSQGGAMACRAAALLECPCGGLILLGSDVPRELPGEGLRRAAPVLLGRGDRDSWYTEEKMAADLRLLESLGVEAEEQVFAGGHEWTDAFRNACAAYLSQRC